MVRWLTLLSSGRTLSDLEVMEYTRYYGMASTNDRLLPLQVSTQPFARHSIFEPFYQQQSTVYTQHPCS